MDNQLFYIVDPAKLKFPFLGRPLQERRNRLRSLLQESASPWATLRLRAPVFLDLVNDIGAAIGVGRDLADQTFENSPFEILPLGEVEQYNPLFGYFDPATVVDYSARFTALDSSSFEKRRDEGVAARVLYAYSSSFTEAAAKTRAIAIDHC